MNRLSRNFKGIFIVEGKEYTSPIRDWCTTIIYKDGNRLGKRKTKLISNLYKDKINKRIEECMNPDSWMSDEEFDELCKDIK